MYPAAYFAHQGGATGEPMFVCYYPATPDCGAFTSDMPGPMYLPTATSPEHAAPLMPAYWGAQGAMFGGIPGHFGVMPCGVATGTPYGMPATSPPHAETAESQVRGLRAAFFARVAFLLGKPFVLHSCRPVVLQTDHNPPQPSRTPIGPPFSAATPGHTMSSLSSDYSAQMSACAKSSYRVLFDTP